MRKQSILAILLGVLVFITVLVLKVILVKAIPAVSIFERQLALDLLLVCISMIIAVKIVHLPISTFNIKIKEIKRSTRKYMLLGLLLGGASTVFIILLHIPAIPLMKQIHPLQMLSVSFIASVAEEFLCRGLVQGFAGKFDTQTNYRYGISPAIISGAIVFSLIHLSIFVFGGSLSTTLTIMFSAFFLGLLAGKSKKESNMGAAISTHLAFNIGGILFAIITNILFIITTGNKVIG